MQGGFFHEFFLLHEILLARIYTRNRPPPQIVPSAAISIPHYLHSLEITLFHPHLPAPRAAAKSA